MNKLLLFGLLVFAGCSITSAPAPVKNGTAEQSPSNVSTVPLNKIDLARIGAVAPKGRVQDKDYHHLPVVENLIAHGTEAIPFLIGKLDDETRIKDHVFELHARPGWLFDRGGSDPAPGKFDVKETLNLSDDAPEIVTKISF
jgi:hypothetical protein